MNKNYYIKNKEGLYFLGFFNGEPRWGHRNGSMPFCSKLKAETQALLLNRFKVERVAA